jgi:hypothetical protein
LELWELWEWDCEWECRLLLLKVLALSPAAAEELMLVPAFLGLLLLSLTTEEGAVVFAGSLELLLLLLP